MSSNSHPFRALRGALLAALAFACNLEGDVGHEGDYTFLPGAPRPDTAPRALRQLLIVEGDGAFDARRYYYFTGDLGPLGLGLESLPRVLAREGRYSLLFENPFDVYDRADESEASGGAEGASAPALEVDGAPVPLEPLSTSDLSRVGASRFVGALENGDFAAAAFIGREPSARPYARLHITRPPAESLELFGELLPSEPEATGTEDGLELHPGPLARPDYLIVDLYQEIEHIEDERPLEAVLRISIAPNIPLVLTTNTLSTAFDSLCWSKDRPLRARITQVARSVLTTARGESALIERRADSVEVPKEAWTDRIPEGEPRDYCAAYR